MPVTEHIRSKPLQIGICLPLCYAFVEWAGAG